MIIDYATPHGRAHTRAADVAFILGCYNNVTPGLIDSILAETDPDARAELIRNQVVTRPGVDVLRRGGQVLVEVQPEAGQTHPPAYAVVGNGRPVSICACPDQP